MYMGYMDRESRWDAQMENGMRMEMNIRMEIRGEVGHEDGDRL